jgi:hypothetical protein
MDYKEKKPEGFDNPGEFTGEKTEAYFRGVIDGLKMEFNRDVR